jgi:uncharacterized protein (TIGR03118 family)
MLRASHRCPQSRSSARLRLEVLEDRCVLSGNVLQTNLVSDLPGVAQQLDPNLVNPWGISESGGSPFWISDNNAGVSTLYNTQGAPVSPVKTLPQNFITIPAPGDPTGNGGTPTGTVFNTTLGTTNGFMITNGTKSAPAIFLFATEDGTIVGWNPGINPAGSDPKLAGTFGTIAVDNSANPSAAAGAVYKGLTIATDAAGVTRLYAANFRSGQIDVFDTSFKPVTDLPMGAFTDKTLPPGYAPFDVQELGGKIYVTYALQNADKHDDVAGPHHGFVDVFNLDGTPGLANGTARLISAGPLNSPWGLAIAPSSFGSLAGDLLVGNFGNGLINVFDSNGKFLTQLKDPDGEPIQIDGLWALKVGNGGNGGDSSKVYFTAGLFGETHGLFGSLAPVAAGTPEGPAEGQMVQAALDVVQLDLKALLTDLSNNASRDVIKQDLANLRGALVQLVQAEQQFARDTRADLFPHRSGDEDSAGREHGGDQDAFFAAFGRGEDHD